MQAIPPSALLNQGLRALAAGQSQVAERLLTQAWHLSVPAPEAAAALGQLAAQQQQWAQAEAWFQRALQVREAQPRVWFALAQMQEVQGRAGEAQESFAQAAQLSPDWAAAHYELARCARELGQADRALAAAQRAVQLKPDDANARQLLGMLQEERGDLPAALQAVDAALRLAPQRATLHHNRGVVLHRQGRSAEALLAHRQALALGLDVPEAHYNLGNTLQALGQTQEALQAYRQALRLAPLHALSLYDLTKLRWALGHEDFDAELRAAEAAAPEADLPSSLQGLMWLRAGEGERARLAYERAISLAPAQGAHWDGLGQTLSLLGQHEQAVHAHHRAVELAPRDVAVLGNAARSLYAAGLTEQGLAMAQRAWQLSPLDQHAIALVGLGWRLSGDTRHAWLHAPEFVLGAVDIEPPPGWADIESFNAALAQELAALHTDAQAPIDQTLRHGTQTRGNIFDLSLPLVTALRQQIEKAISSWLVERPQDPEHPFLGRNTGRWRFSDSWSSRLRSSGFHTNHVHSHGWLSCCYYIQTPPSALQSTTHEGWIKFGEPDLPEPLRSELPPSSFLAPKPGRLALFPSYFWHGTVPFQADGRHRLTIAFDVIPA
ncbi:MAG: tetratricopeptide repeat protein [Rhizobium sp.]|nr:MAG: tetratricopeptide repeat protein [Rhizobium sp.]